MPKYIPRTRSLRLPGWSYKNPSWYFITICSFDRESIFGEIENGIMVPNELGKIAQTHWLNIPVHYHNVQLDEFVLMPNHLHGLIWLGPPQNVGVGARLCRALPHKNIKHHGGIHLNGPGTLSSIIRNFKSYMTREINQTHGNPGDVIWQRSFHDEIIRDEDALERIREYIRQNPEEWERDPLHESDY